MPEDIRWKQRFDNFKRALHQLSLAVQLMDQRPLSDLVTTIHDSYYPTFLDLKERLSPER